MGNWFANVLVISSLNLFCGSFESQEIENMADKDNEKPKRGPGRPRKDEEKRGAHFRKPESEKVGRKPYVPTGNPRGAKPKDQKE